jgi:HPr kinase/phosphorylase
MPFPRLSVADAFDRFESDLKLRWLAGDSGRQRVLTRDAEASKRPRLLGPLNYNSANRIQLLGAAEIRSFSGDDALSESRFEFPLTKASDVFMVSDGLTPPAALAALADANDIALIGSSLAYGELLKGLRYGLTRALAEREIVHGVMMDVLGTGVLITGDASVGKSELALELISRGHILVADDAPEFSRIAPNTIECRCPPLLQDFLEVRGLGVLNIARMYGDAHTRKRKILRFIIDLQVVSSVGLEGLSFDGNRMSEPSTTRTLLGTEIAERTIPVAPGRNLAVLVEAAVREHILRSSGYSATQALVENQARLIGNSPDSPDSAERRHKG